MNGGTADNAVGDGAAAATYILGSVTLVQASDPRVSGSGRGWRWGRTRRGGVMPSRSERVKVKRCYDRSDWEASCDG